MAPSAVAHAARRLLTLLSTAPGAHEIERLRERRRRGTLPAREAAAFVVRETLHVARQKGLPERSSALTYTLILSIVPLLAIGFTFFKNFGGLQTLLDDTIKPIIVTHFQHQVAEQLSSYLDLLLTQLDTKALSVVSFVTFLGTVLALLMHVENVLNDVFDARKDRSLLRKVSNYWILMSFGPVLIAFSSVKSAEFLKRFAFAEHWMGHLLGTFGVLDLIRYLVGVGIQGAAVMVLFAFMPNRRTGWKALSGGALVTSVLFEALQFVNVYLTKRALADSTVTEIYGTIPILAVIFFVWIRLVWMVVLFGACVCVALSRLLDETPEQAGRAGLRAEISLCARLFEAAVSAFEAEERPAAFEALVPALAVARSEADKALGWLVDARLLFVHEEGRQTLLVPTPRARAAHADPRRFLAAVVMAGGEGDGSEGATTAATARESDNVTKQKTNEGTKHVTNDDTTPAGPVPFADRVVAVMRKGTT